MKQSKPVIGVTGGVGAGKSTVLRYLEKNYGVAVIMADEVGRELMAPGKSVYKALVENYGEGILKEAEAAPDQAGEETQGTRAIDTAVLAGIAFKDEDSQKRINAIEHPIIKEEIVHRIVEALACERVTGVVVEAALLKEGGLCELCDEVWYVYARRAVRVERLRKSRGYSVEKCRAILKRQLTDKAFRSIADVVIDNSGSSEMTGKKLDREMKRVLR